MPSIFQAKPMSNKKCSISAISLFLIIRIFCLSATAEVYNTNNNPKPIPSQFSKFSRTTTTTTLCNNIPYKSACESILSSLEASKLSLPTNPKDLFDHSVEFSINHLRSAHELASILSLSHHQSPTNNNMKDCLELLYDSLDQLSNVVNRKKNPTHTHTDIQTWLSASLTNQQTCLESLQFRKFNTVYEKGEVMVSMARNLSQYLSNSLSLYVSHYVKKDGSRKLLSENGFPGWVSVSEWKLLEAPVSEIKMKAHAVVAKDGSGTHKTIGEAIEMLAAAAVASLDGGGGGRNVIYLKAGTYNENIKIPTSQKNVLLVGDGKDKTVIVGSRNANDGWSTFETATVGVMGDGFMAKGITFVNSAGPNKHQAVALRVGSDKSVIYQCSIQGYQDTLFTLSKRQFYRDSDIYGSLDFIFGNAAVVFQNCNIFSRRAGSKNYITAQGRTDPNQNTGISIHNCKISGVQNTYLGRPWKKYSRTIIMQSFLDGSINGAGWFPWSGNFALNTLYYAEYMNSGPGASTSGRVKWPGYHASISDAEAQTFTVGSFIDGNMWLPATGVSFDSGLIG